MNLQTRLTLWAVTLTAVFATIASALVLSSEIDRQLADTRHDIDLIAPFAVEFVRHSIDRDTTSATAQQAIAKDAPLLSSELAQLLTGMKPLVEIAVCDDRRVIVGDSFEDRIGGACPELPNWTAAFSRSNWLDRVELLWHGSGNYEASEEVDDTRTGAPVFFIKLLLRPQIVRGELAPVLRTSLTISALAILGSVLAAFVFSNFALRPLGKLSQMIDRIVKGEYEFAGESPAPKKDEFNIVASKVNLLGQRLRGAHAEFSDLRTNVERLLDELEDAVLIFARDGHLIAAAGSVERFFDLPRDTLVNRKIGEIFPGETPIGLLLSEAVRTGATMRNRRVPIERGPKFALLTVEFLQSTAAGGMLVRLRDPEATRQIGRQLQTADRLSAISSLTKGVAHEVKNPLNAILMHVELARMKMAQGDYDLDQQMEIVTGEIMRLDRVVKTFLDFTRPVQLNMTEMHLCRFMQDLAALARPQAEAVGVEIVEDLRVEAVVTVDADLLKQAVFNIVVNAIEAMPGGGTLRFEASLKGDDAEIRIADNGPGIPSEVKEKIYDLYFTTKEHGSGIGLAMTYRIVQLHGGTIDFTSEPKRGTTFSLRFPAQVPA